MSCIDLPTECNRHAQDTCIKFADVHAFFKPDGECSTRIAYINGRDNTVVVHRVLYKEVADGDCVLLYTKSKEGFFYVYDQMLFHLVIWASMVGKMPAEVIKGNHLTIGEHANGEWNIHETMYDEYHLENRVYLKPRKKTHIHYTVSSDTSVLVKKNRGGVPHLSSARAIWNDIVCSMGMSGGGKKRKYIELAPIPAEEAAWITPVAMAAPRFEEGAITPLPYVPLTRLMETAHGILGGIGKRQGLLVSDTRRRCTFLWMTDF